VGSNPTLSASDFINLDTRAGLLLMYATVMLWLFGFVGVMTDCACVAAVYEMSRRRLSRSAAYGAAELILGLTCVGRSVVDISVFENPSESSFTLKTIWEYR
jgi:hypothetical protein